MIRKLLINVDSCPPLIVKDGKMTYGNGPESGTYYPNSNDIKFKTQIFFEK